MCPEGRQETEQVGMQTSEETGNLGQMKLCDLGQWQRGRKR